MYSHNQIHQTNGFEHKRESLTRDEAIDQAYAGVHGFVNSIVKYNEGDGFCDGYRNKIEDS